MCPQWKPSNYRCKRSRTPHQNYFSSLTQFTKAVIRAKENGRHPRHAEKKRDKGKKWRKRRENEQGGQWQLISGPQAILFIFAPSLQHFLYIHGSKDWGTKIKTLTMISHESCKQVHSTRSCEAMAKQLCASAGTPGWPTAWLPHLLLNWFTPPREENDYNREFFRTWLVLVWGKVL